MHKGLFFLLALLLSVPTSGANRAEGNAQKTNLWVDADRGRPGASGSQERPCRSISEAIDLLPETLTRSVMIQIAGGQYLTTSAVFL